MISYKQIDEYFEVNGLKIIVCALIIISLIFYLFFSNNGLGLAYNDARSHLDIGRRVVEGLTPGIAQLGSVWLPLPHILMLPTIWNDFMWHSGLAGAIISMVSYVICGAYIWLILKKLAIRPSLRLLGVSIFALNPNILYLQSTAMTELVLMCVITAAIYELISYFVLKEKYTLIKSAFWIMLATLVRYEGWFLFLVATAFIVLTTFREKGNKAAEGTLILFTTLSGFGIFMWFVWNKIIFGDFLYFALGPFSAHAQQQQLQAAGDLLTKGNLQFAIKTYTFALFYTLGPISFIGMILGATLLFFDKRLEKTLKIAAVAFLFSPVLFNILALHLGHSVIFIEGLSGKSWFNVRYGVMALPAAAVFCTYLAEKSKNLGYLLIVLFFISSTYGIINIKQAVTISDAVYGSSGKDVSQIASWMKENSNDGKSRVLISAASHDAVIFSSGLHMNKIIHEGTGPFWQSATTTPDRWAKYIVMRTNDTNDSVFRLLQNNQNALKKYDLGYKGNFADIYVLKEEFTPYLAQDFSIKTFGNWRKQKSTSEKETQQQLKQLTQSNQQSTSPKLTKSESATLFGMGSLQKSGTYILIIFITIFLGAISMLEKISKKSY